jgi:hypothetical protein
MPAATVAVTLCAEAPLAAKSIASKPLPNSQAALRRLEIFWSALRSTLDFVSLAFAVRIKCSSPLGQRMWDVSAPVSVLSECGSDRTTGKLVPREPRLACCFSIPQLLGQIRMKEPFRVRTWSVRSRT